MAKLCLETLQVSPLPEVWCSNLLPKLCSQLHQRWTWAFHKYIHTNIHKVGTSLVVQWLRICLPMQGTQVQSLVQEDPTCHRATKPVHHNYWACTLELTSHNYWSLHVLETSSHDYWAHVLQLLKPGCVEPLIHNKRSHRGDLVQDGRVEGCALTPSCESTGITTNCWTIINRKTPERTKKDIPHPKTKEKP